MITNLTEINGTLREDGTLLLDQKPNIAPGRVRVLVQPLVDYTQTEIWKFFEKIRAEQMAGGSVARTGEEIDADVAAMRDEDDDRTQQIERIQEECRQHREQHGRSEAE